MSVIDSGITTDIFVETQSGFVPIAEVKHGDFVRQGSGTLIPVQSVSDYRARLARISEAKEAVCEAAKAWYVAKLDTAEEATTALEEAVDALIKAEGE